VTIGNTIENIYEDMDVKTHHTAKGASRDIRDRYIRSFCVRSGSIDRSLPPIGVHSTQCRPDFNISPILPVCGNVAKRANVAGSSRKHVKKEKNRRRGEGRERTAGSSREFRGSNTWKNKRIISTNERLFETLNSANWLGSPRRIANYR